MPWYWYGVIIWVFLSIVINLSEVIVKIRLKKQEKNHYVDLHLWFLYKLIHLHKTFSLTQTKENAVAQTVKKDSKKNKKRSKQVHIMLQQIADFYGVMKKFLKHVKVEKMTWESKIGSGDAMVTGILSGLTWGIKGTLIGIISKYMKLKKKPVIAVHPDYQQERFESRFECILRFRVGYLIVTGIRFILKYLKGGWKNAWRSSYSRFNENGYGKFKRDG